MAFHKNKQKVVAGALVVSTWAIDVAIAPETVQASTTASGNLSASVSIPYACDITNVSIGTLTGSSASYSYTGSFMYSQNDDTTWNISGGSVSAPTSASLSVGISVSDSSLGNLVSASGDQTSLYNGTGSLSGNHASHYASYVVSMNEQIAPTMYAGEYTISGVISCEQAMN